VKPWWISGFKYVGMMYRRDPKTGKLVFVRVYEYVGNPRIFHVDKER
jgi:hypothetical protein